MQPATEPRPPLVQADELRLLAQVGLLAASHGDVGAAEAIFTAVEAERADAPLPYVGLAMAYLNCGRAPEAIAALERGLAAVAPANRPEVQAFLGLALQVGGRLSESRKALQLAGDVPMARAMRGEGPPDVATATAQDMEES